MAILIFLNFNIVTSKIYVTHTHACPMNCKDNFHEVKNCKKNSTPIIAEFSFFLNNWNIHIFIFLSNISIPCTSSMKEDVLL